MLRTIQSSYTSKRTGKTQQITYTEVDSFDGIQSLPVGAAGAFCFCNGKLVIVYAKKRDTWEIPGGGREQGEAFDDCITREILEESNMKVIKLVPIGYDTFSYDNGEENQYVLRYAALVEPIGEFSGDGAEDGEITEVKLIDPSQYSMYFDWGERSAVMIEKAKKVLGI